MSAPGCKTTEGERWGWGGHKGDNLQKVVQPRHLISVRRPSRLTVLTVTEQTNGIN